MPIPFTCPHCGKQNSIGDQYAGSSAACGACGQTVMVPGNTLSSFSGSNYPPPQRKSSGGSPVVIIIVVLAVCGGGVLSVGCLSALLFPALGSAREAARRASCANNMRELAIAIQVHQDQRGDMPPLQLTTQAGRPLHSWRTLLLPYLEQQALFRQMKLDQPWDAPGNRMLGVGKHEVFQCPSSENGSSNLTNYFSVLGEFAPLQPAAIPQGMDPRRYRSNTKFVDIVDGLAFTVGAFEVEGLRNHWMQPSDPGCCRSRQPHQFVAERSLRFQSPPQRRQPGVSRRPHQFPAQPCVAGCAEEVRRPTRRRAS